MANDITKVEKAHHIEILNDASLQLLGIKEEKEIYRILVSAITKIVPGIYCVVSKLQSDDMNFRIVHSCGLDNYMQTIKLLLGKDPYEMDFPFKDLAEEHRKGFDSRKLYHFEDGLYGLSVGAINKTLCRTIEKIIGISDIYATSFYLEDHFFGGISLFIPKRVMKSGIMDEKAILAIETLSNLASVLIQKQRYNDALVQSRMVAEAGYSRTNLLLGNLTDIAWKANGDGSNIVDLKNNFKDFYGHPVEDFQVNSNLWTDLVHPDDKDLIKKSGEELFRNGQSMAEYRVVRPDGSIIWLNDRKSIVYNEEGKAIMMGGIAKDITDKKRLEEELQIKNFALDVSPVAIGLADLNGILFFANEAFVNLWGYTCKEEILGKHISNFAFSKEQMNDVLKTIKEGKIYWGEGRSVRLNETSFESIISATMVKHNGVSLCLMAVFTDITDQKIMERKLQEMILSKDKLFSIIAHDLKSPLSAFLGLTNVLVNESDSLTTEDRLTYIDLLHKSAVSTYILLENLLEWSQLQTSTYEVHKNYFSLKSLIEECIALYAATANNKLITIKHDVADEVQVFVDGNSLKTILRNLLNNALKYTNEGGTVTIHALQKVDEIELSIQDTGIGIKPEILNKLFQVGESTSTPGTNREKGTGLGLIICRELLDRNGGAIQVESEVGKGTIFRIQLPDLVSPAQ